MLDEVIDDPAFLVPAGTVTLLVGDRTAALVDLVGVRGGVVAPGDGPVVGAFPTAGEAVTCAIEAMTATVDASDRPRFTLLTGEVMERGTRGYLGQLRHRAERLYDIANPGQLLLSQATVDLAVDVLAADGYRARDLGLHRLADLARAERVWDVSGPDLPAIDEPLRSLDHLSNNLPIQTTALLGRANELAEIVRVVSDARLTTLTGAGGCGKTRLAVHVGAEVLHAHPDGVWLIDLAQTTDGADVPRAIADAIGVQLPSGGDLASQLAAHLVGRDAVLVLDNCEHLLDACARTVEVLLRTTASVTVLATSREPLGVPGEVVWRVPSLASPPLEHGHVAIETLEHYAAVELFCDRAARSRAGFVLDQDSASAIAQICTRLDGIPLAIELAAARVRVLSPAQIADGLHDQFRLLTGGARTALPRQQTLLASVDWSHALLNDLEQLLLRRLSVFSGSFDLHVAELVCSLDPLAPHHVLDLLGQLVDKSLVQLDAGEPEGRYRMLESVRQYAAMKLRESDEAVAVRDRHRDVFTDRALGAAAALKRTGAAQVMAELWREHDDIRLALAWSEASGDLERAFAAAAALGELWIARGHSVEGVAWAKRALDADDVDEEVRARVLAVGARLAYATEPTGELADAALALWGERTPDPDLAVAKVINGAFRIMTGSDGRELVAEGVADARATNDPWAIAYALLYAQYLELDDPRRATAMLDEATDLAHQFGSEHLALRCAHAHAIRLVRHGRVREGVEAYRRILPAVRSHHEPGTVAEALGVYGGALMESGDLDGAAPVLAESVRLFEAAGYHATASQLSEALLAAYRDDFETARARARELLDGEDRVAGRATSAFIATVVELAAGDVHAADVMLTIARDELSDVWATPRLRMEGAPLEAEIARGKGDLARAEALAHEVIGISSEAGDLFGCIRAIETIGLVAAETDQLDEAARLLRAASRVRTELGQTRFPEEQRRIDTVMEALPTADEAVMTLEEAVAYARRGRGKRRRARAGWASLTASELQVAALVAEGLTNDQVGERLFISGKTVRSHLSNIFSKLGITSRAQLAVEFTKRSGG